MAADEALDAELSTTPYAYVAPIAKGGMGSVHLVRHRALGHELVMKLLVSPTDEGELTRRLLREGRVLKSLSHPHIVQVVDFGFTKERRPYLVSEALRGKTLRQEVRARGPLAVAEVLDVTTQILSGLAHAHAAGFVHRDLKPENLLWLDADEEGRRSIKILDFGIVKILDDDANVKLGDAVPTAPGMAIGTPAYAPPEQIRGERVDVRADIYALGGVMFFLLTGRAPFLGIDIVDLMRAHLLDRPIPPSRIRAEVPAMIDAVVLEALAKDPSARFASAEKMLEAVRGVSERLGAGASLPSRTVRLDEIDTQPLPQASLRALALESVKQDGGGAWARTAPISREALRELGARVEEAPPIAEQAPPVQAPSPPARPRPESAPTQPLPPQAPTLPSRQVEVHAPHSPLPSTRTTYDPVKIVVLFAAIAVALLWLLYVLATSR